AHAVDRRPFGPLDLETASAGRPGMAAGTSAALVRGDRREVRRQLFRAFRRRRYAGQGFRRAGVAWRAARILFRAVLGDVLAGLGAGGAGRAADMAGAARARRTISSGVVDSVL